MSNKEKTREEPFVEEFNEVEGKEENSLVLHNDEVNTFDFVIDALMEVCGHDSIQAEQCAMIAHYNGKCAVKKGSISDLKPPYEEMTNRQLTVSIT